MGSLLSIFSTKQYLAMCFDGYNICCPIKGKCCKSSMHVYKEKIYDAMFKIHKHSNKGMYMLVLKIWRHCTHLILFRICKPS